jgi:hypothetical protein
LADSSPDPPSRLRECQQIVTMPVLRVTESFAIPSAVIVRAPSSAVLLPWAPVGCPL